MQKWPNASYRFSRFFLKLQKMMLKKNRQEFFRLSQTQNTRSGDSLNNDFSLREEKKNRCKLNYSAFLAATLMLLLLDNQTKPNQNIHTMSSIGSSDPACMVITHFNTWLTFVCYHHNFSIMLCNTKLEKTSQKRKESMVNMVLLVLFLLFLCSYLENKKITENLYNRNYISLAMVSFLVCPVCYWVLYQCCWKSVTYLPTCNFSGNR